MFQIVLDYGDHPTAATPTPARDRSVDASGPIRSRPIAPASRSAPTAAASGVLVFHNFPPTPTVGADCLVRSTRLSRTRTSRRPPIRAIRSTRFWRRSRRPATARAGRGYLIAAPLPPLEFDYSQPELQPDDPHRSIATASSNLPEGIDGARFQLGRPRRRRAVRHPHRRRRRVVLQAQPEPDQPGRAAGRHAWRPAPASARSRRSPPLPSPLGSRRQPAAARPGRRRPARRSSSFEPASAGFFERTERRATGSRSGRSPRCRRSTGRDPNLQVRRPHRRRPRRRADHRGRRVHLVPVARRGRLRRRASACRTPWDEERGPQVVFADGTETVFLADMSRRRPERPRARPQRRGLLLAEPRLRPLRRQGHDGRRAALRRRRALRSAPRPARRHRRLGHDRPPLRRRRTASASASTSRATPGPQPTAHRRSSRRPTRLSAVQVVDLLGTGTACLVWSSPLPAATCGAAALRRPDGRRRSRTC